LDRVIRLEACTVDLDLRLATRDGEQHALTEREVLFLEYMLARPGQAVSRDDLLVDVWEYSANVVTRAVDIAVRRLRMKVEADPAHPTHILTVRGVGYRFESTDDRPPGAHAPPHPSASATVPAPTSAFVGRTDELATLAGLVADGPRLITILGPPGIGKTRLAVEYASRRTASAWFADLCDSYSAGDVLRVVAETLDVGLGPDVPREEIIDRISRVLGRSPSLLVLDNFEQVVDRASGEVTALLAHCPSTRFIVTSRERLHLDGEHCISLEELPASDAVAMLLERARAVRHDWGGADEVIDAIAAQLDGNPLAIELAAGRASLLGPQALLDGLQHRFRLLAKAGRATSPRQATLYAAIDWSWSLLSDWERSALMQCSVFRGGFSVEAASVVVDLADNDAAPWVVDWLQALTDKSLLRSSTDPSAQTRFSLYESIREFVETQLDRSGKARRVTGRHREYYLDLVDGLTDAARGRLGAQSLRILALEANNLRAIHRRSVGVDPNATIRSALALDELLAVRGPFEERSELLDAAVDAAVTARDQALTRLARAHVHHVRRDVDAAHADLQVALGATSTRALQPIHGEVLAAFAQFSAELHELDEAVRFAGEALEVARATGHARLEAVATNVLGRVACEREQFDEALVYNESARDLGHEAADWRVALSATSNLGYIARARGQFDDAEHAYQGALAIAREHEDRAKTALILQNLGALESSRGRLLSARTYQAESAQLHRACGSRLLLAKSLGNLGIVKVATGDLDEARAHLEEALAMVGPLADARAEGLIRGNLGICLAQIGDLDRAAHMLTAAVALLERVYSPFVTAYFNAHLAAVEADRDDLPHAEAAFAIASEHLSGAGHPVAEALTMVIRGHLEMARHRQEPTAGHREEARRLLDEAAAAAVTDAPLGSVLNTVLPSELVSAMASLERVIALSDRS
jgi:predicted ATPase